MSTAPVPLVGFSDLGDDAFRDAALDAFLVRQTLLEKEARGKEKDMEQEQDDFEKLFS